MRGVYKNFTIQDSKAKIQRALAEGGAELKTSEVRAKADLTEIGG